jgi:hypothetical protein
MRRRAAAFAATTSLMLGFFGATNDAAAQPAPACTSPKTTCTGEGGYYASAEDLNRVTAVGDPLLKELRTCLDGAGGKHITPTFVVRWDSDGNAVAVKIDVPGYESQPCVAKIQAKLQTLQNPHETAIRCEYGCAKPASTPPPVPPPVVVPAPTPSTTPTTATPPPRAAPPVVKKEEFHTEKVWYGWQTLTADGISFAMIFAGTAAKSGALVGLGVGSFLLATPIVHMAHGNVGPGFGSVAMRLLVPIIGAGIGGLVGLIAGGSQGRGVDQIGNGASGGAYGLVIGFYIGVAGCIAIDAAGLAWTKERVEGPAPPSSALNNNKNKQKQWFTLSPGVNIQKDQAALGFSGRF